MRPALAVMLALTILTQSGVSFANGSADSTVTDAMLNRAIFVNDSLRIDNARLAALLELEREAGAIPDSFWRNWKSWGTFFAFGLVTGWAVTR